MKRRQFISTAAAPALATLGIGSTLAQSDKPIKLLVGFPPGGSIDAVARLLADKMKDELKAPVIVENKVGAGGRLVAELIKNAASDSNTYMITPFVVPVLAPLVFSKLNYDPAVDFAPVGHVCSFDFGFTVKADHPAKTVTELVNWFKANPQKSSFGSPSAGSLPHFFGLLLGREVKADVVHVAYNGGAPLQTAVLGDQVPLGIDVVFEWLQNHRAGKLRVIGTTGNNRSKVLPDVPTLREQGFGNMVGSGWFGLYAPAKAPTTEIARVNAALNKVLAQSDVAERMLALGLEAGGGSPSDLTRREREDTGRWGPVVKASGFKAD